MTDFKMVGVSDKGSGDQGWQGNHSESTLKERKARHELTGRLDENLWCLKSTGLYSVIGRATSETSTYCIRLE